MKLIPIGQSTSDMELGGKGAGLVALKAAGLTIPATYLILSSSIAEWLQEIGAELSALRGSLDESEALEVASEIQSAIVNAELPKELLAELGRMLECHSRIIIRSSASAEDGRQASLAGHFESVVAQTMDGVATAIYVCLTSFFEPHCVVALRRLNALETLEIAMVVQEFIPASAAGVSFTSGETEVPEIYSEVCFGFGQALVDGLVTPQRVVRSKLEYRDIHTLTVARTLPDAMPHDIVAFEFMGRIVTGLMTSADTSAGLLTVDRTLDLCGVDCLSHTQIAELEAAVLHLRARCDYDIDVEWVFAECGRLVFVQVRPVTMRLGPVVHGNSAVQIASSGVACGPARIVRDHSQARGVEAGSVVVASTTNPQYISALLAASGVIAEEGGMLCHTAIVARELGIPCLLNVQNATSRFVDYEMVGIDTSADEPFSCVMRAANAGGDFMEICREAVAGGFLVLGAEGLSFKATVEPILIRECLNNWSY